MLKTYFKFLTVVFIIIILTSTVGVAEIPLRVVVNGEKVNFPDASLLLTKTEERKYP